MGEACDMPRFMRSEYLIEIPAVLFEISNVIVPVAPMLS
jgi:hypothetical protein